MKESKIVSDIRKHLKKNGWLPWKNHGSQFSEAGLPDLMAVKNCRFIALEVKKPGGKATNLQKLWIANLASEGVIAAVVYSVDDVIELIGED